MSEPGGGNPIVTASVVLLLVGGGWYFFRHYDVRGLDQVSVSPKPGVTETAGEGEPTARRLTSYRDPVSGVIVGANPGIGQTPDPAADARAIADGRRAGRFDNLRIASWALDGLGPTKLSRDAAVTHMAEVIRRFDIVALQQVGVTERDILPRFVDRLNEGTSRYDFVIGSPTGPEDRPERMAFVFDTERVEVDRTQTYEVADPDNALTYDPLVAWFRAAGPPVDRAWTFSLVNIRVDLGRAREEVPKIPGLLRSVRDDGRGEDDVVLAGLFQSDAATLVAAMGGTPVLVAVSGHPTDVRGRRQTSNLLVDRHRTTEFLGRGGAVDFLRLYNLAIDEAEAVTTQLPVYGEFTATEVGEF